MHSITNTAAFLLVHPVCSKLLVGLFDLWMDRTSLTYICGWMVGWHWMTQKEYGLYVFEMTRIYALCIC